MRKIFLLFVLLIPFFLSAAERPQPYKIVSFKSRSTQSDIRLCATLNRYFINSTPRVMKEYIQVVPASDFGLEASYDTLCITGLKPRTRYSVTFAQDLPIGKQHLDKEYRFEQETGDYRPSFRFKESGYIIPAKGEISTPLESRNLQKVAVNLYRINQNNLMQSINQYGLRESLAKYELNDIKDESGYLLWEKRLTIRSVLNKKVVTAIPIGSALKERKPGVYILAVAPIGKDGEADWYSAQTQWFMVSDIGIFAEKGEEKLRVYTKHIGDASAYSGVKLELISKNNEVLATTTTKNGYASFKSPLLNGKDALAARAIYAYGKGGDFTVLDLERPKLDLSDRGDSGRKAPHGFDAFIYSNRGIFKPKSTIPFHLLVTRENGKRAKNLTFSAKLVDSKEKSVAVEKVVTDSFGHAEGSFRLPNKTGYYRILLYANNKEPIGKLGFLVEDFIPPKIEVNVKSRPELIKPFQKVELTLQAQYLTGDFLANPKVDYSVSLASSKVLEKKYKGYRFGKADEKHFRQFIYDASEVGDSNGTVTLPILIDRVAESSLPLVASIKVHVLEPGGRGIERYFAIPYLNQEGYIGIKPKFPNDAIDLGATPAFDILYLKSFKPAAKKLKWRLILEEPHWNWRSSGENGWEYYVTYEDIKVLKKGDIAVQEHPTPLQLEKLDWGSYRLELISDEGVVSSYRFSSGYEEGASKVSPDRLPIKLNKQQFTPGEELKAEIQTKFSGPVIVQIASNRILATKELQAVANKPLHVNFKIKKKWGASLYLLATAFRAQSAKLGANRAVGLAHLRVVNPKNRIDIAIEHPKRIHSKTTLQLHIHSKSAKTTETKITVAAVDKGVLNLTHYEVPDPYSYFFGQKRLGVELHDVYSELIKPAGEHAEFDVGAGDMEEDENNPIATNKRSIVALMSKVISLDKEGNGEVAFTIPDYQGALEIMGVAWSKKGVGSSSSEVIVKDPISLELYMPRFLSVGDKATILAQVRFDKSVPNGRYLLKIKADESVVIEPKEFSFDLAAKRELRLPLHIKALQNKDANITLEVVSGEKLLASRTVALATRMPFIKTYARSVGVIDSGALVDFKSVIDPKKWSNLGNFNLKISSTPLLAVETLKKSLKDYCCRCGEQTTSRGFAFINDPKERSIVAESIERLYELQKYDGGFSLWGGSEASQWVSSYILDFLTRARDAGFEVSQKRVEDGLRYLQQHLSRWSKDSNKVDADLYALYVLARNKHIVISDINYHLQDPNGVIKTSSGWAYLAATLNLLGEKEQAKKLFAKAKERLYQSGDFYSNFGGSLRNKALLVVLESEAGLKAMAQPLFIDLAFDTKERKYLSTQEMSILIRAQKAMDIPSSAMHIRVDGKEFNGKEFVEHYSSINKLPNIENLGTASLWYRLSFVASPNPKGYSVGDNHGFTIQKELFTLDGKRVDPNNIPQGERIVVVISGVVEDRAIHHPLILDLLPSGFEIENPNISGYDETEGLKWLGEKSATVKQAYRDDRYIAALQEDSIGKFKVAYTVRAVTKGEFAYAPTLIEAMYKPYYRALSINKSDTVIIKDKKDIITPSEQNSTTSSESNQTTGLTSSDYKKAFTTPLGDLKKYSTLELYYLRNGIFAQAGLNFDKSNPALERLFSHFSWYKPKFESASLVYSMLTPLQKNNVQNLLKEEKRRLGGLVFADFYRVRSRELPASFLKRYTKPQLRILRNSLIARYGYIFKDKRLQQIFENLPWYKPNPHASTSEIIDHLMSPIERKNLDTILQVEKTLQ